MKRMIIRQFSDLVEGSLVGERECSYNDPRDIQGVLRLVLRNCSDFMNTEDIPITQDSITL